MSKVIDELKGEELSSMLCINWPSEWQKKITRSWAIPVSKWNNNGWTWIQGIEFFSDFGCECQKRIQQRISQNWQDRKNLFCWSKMPWKRVRDRIIFRCLNISLITRIERQRIRAQERQCQQKSTRLVFAEHWAGKSQRTLVCWGPWAVHLGASGCRVWRRSRCFWSFAWPVLFFSCYISM